MDRELLEEFQAGKYENGDGYRYFVPRSVDTRWAWTDGELSDLLQKASLKLGELNSYARLVPSVELFALLYVTSEAVLSSRIEGTATTFDEALLPFEEIQAERRDDWLEVKNYSSALEFAIDQLSTLPISTRLLRDTHRRLMEGARGEARNPGEFRRSQNWIGGSNPNAAVFVPPAHGFVPELMSDLEKFLNNSKAVLPSLIKIGIAHYQFETIHPFLDGNGRTGRLLIALFLAAEKILDIPLLHISLYFERDRELYYQKLTNVREKNDMLGWLKYFLQGIEFAATRSAERLSAIIKLRQDLESQVNARYGRRTASALLLLSRLFEHPVIKRRDVRGWIKGSGKAANDLVNLFVSDGMLREVTGKARNQVFIFEPLVRLF